MFLIRFCINIYFAHMKFRLIQGRWLAVFLHVALWTLFISYPYIVRQSFGGHGAESGKTTSYELHNFVNIVTWIALFYVNAFVLMPLYFNKRKYERYSLVIFGAFVVLSFINFISFNIFLPHLPFKFVGLLLFYVVPTFFVLLWSIAYRILVDKLREDRNKVERQTENLRTELSFLRSQVSPHFMFNVMNNMVALARKKSDLLEPSLIKLSSLLRYMLYETDEDQVSLQKEIEYLQSYIDLQKQRFANNVMINVSLDGGGGQHQIHPMLLIPFVENAFKHGTGIFTPQIDISLRTDNTKLFFEVSNRYSENGDEVKDKSSGIGLANVRRRLNLLYGDKHYLEIVRENNRFTVKLEILVS
jgi:two-component system, LytTR family, sensor kinase